MASLEQPDLVQYRIDAHKHSGVISLFNQHFVKSGTFTKDYSKILSSARGLREATDYDDFYLVSKRVTIIATRHFPGRPPRRKLPGPDFSPFLAGAFFQAVKIPPSRNCLVFLFLQIPSPSPAKFRPCSG